MQFVSGTRFYRKHINTDKLPDICVPAEAYVAIPIVYSSLEMCAIAFVFAFLALSSTANNIDEKTKYF